MEKYFDFTPTEWEIIKHRLEAPDAIYEAVFKDHKNSILKQVDRWDVAKITEKLIEQGPWICIETRAEYEVLRDAIEGSVFIPIARAANCGRTNTPAPDEITHGQYMRYCRAAKGIETKTGWQLPRN